MKKMYEKYARVLLEKGVNLKKGQPLVIYAPIETFEFVRVLGNIACEMGSKDIYFDFDDDYLKHSELKYFSIDELNESQFYKKNIYDDYAKKDAAFLMLKSDCSDLMIDIDNDKLSSTAKTFRITRPLFKEKQRASQVAWCIASVATKIWANKIFPNDKDSISKLWNEIFKCCLIDQENPIEAWNQKIATLKEKCKILNNLNLSKLRYQNSLGTDLEVRLSKQHIWLSGGETLSDGRTYVANIPTEEVFTSPDKYGTNGVVYASKPLVYNGGIIEDMKLVFKNGKVIEAYSKSNQKLLDMLLNSYEDIRYLGEIALVNHNSPISNTDLLFYLTLFDENSSCHLALGSGFQVCIKNGVNLTQPELDEIGLNISSGHIDFMIGTKDLKITGKTFDNDEIEIFENGNFSNKLIKKIKNF